MRGCGRIERPAFPAPSDFLGGKINGKARVEARRDCEIVSANEMSCPDLIRASINLRKSSFS
jgi:hypothetical protein